MDNKALEQAAREAGISSGFINAHGKQQETAPETRQKLLDAMNFSHRPEPEFSPVPGVQVFTTGGRLALPVSGNGEYQWQLQQENGTRHQGRISGEMTLVLPGKIPAGYHQLTLSRNEQHWHCRVIVAPKRCFEPEALLSGKKLWGACIQLYTLRSENNWGIGDFGDLRQLLPQIAERGGAFVGLNPIHALYPANPTAASPYSPSSRRWLNVIYIDVNEVEDFRLRDEAQQRLALPQTRKRLKAARAAEVVDYSEVMALKLAGLRLAYQRFVTRPARDP